MNAKTLLNIISPILNLRYDITWKGLDCLEGQGPFLLLPNHPAEIDPLLLLVGLWPKLKIRPVLLSNFHRNPIIGCYTRAVRAIPLPDLENNQDASAVSEVQQAIDNICQALSEGDNILLYPSGRLMRGGLEKLMGASSAFQIITKVKHVKVRLIKTRGLYGSLSSTAPKQGERPHPIVFGIKAFFLLLRYGVWFMPRRQVSISIEPASNDLLRADTKQKFNDLLEARFNQDGPEIPASNIIKLSTDAAATSKSKAEDSRAFNPEVWGIIKDKLSELSGLEAEKIEASFSLREDLALDSIQLIELAHWLKDEFNCRTPRIRHLKTAASLYDIALR